MKHLPLDPSIFIENRKRFCKQLLPGSLAIFNSNDEVPVSADAIHPFKQNTDLYWLTGIAQEDTMLVMFPHNPDPRYREVLVLTYPDADMEKWVGRRLTKAEATAISGVQTVVWLTGFDTRLMAWMHQTDHVYLNTIEHDRKPNHLPTRDYRFIAQVQQQYPLHSYHRSQKLLKPLRSVKLPQEIAVMETAVAITHKAFRRVLGFVKPGVGEHEVHAEIVHEFLRHRAQGEAYGSIIAGGAHALVLHYVDNNAPCADGDLLLMDFGANYGGYCADLTRTIPVNGKFSPRQAQLYNACLHLHHYAKSLLRPGISIKDCHDLVADEATRLFVDMGLISQADADNDDRSELTTRAYRKYLYHGISHHLGIDVHDYGSFTDPMVPGMVFTVEPGIYVAEEGIGIRIENNVVITETGHRDLFEGIPITIEEIEAAMAHH
jgi:Xaa-Pro aminopeptidase